MRREKRLQHRAIEFIFVFRHDRRSVGRDAGGERANVVEPQGVLPIRFGHQTRVGEARPVLLPFVICSFVIPRASTSHSPAASVSN